MAGRQVPSEGFSRRVLSVSPTAPAAWPRRGSSQAPDAVRRGARGPCPAAAAWFVAPARRAVGRVGTDLPEYPFCRQLREYRALPGQWLARRPRPRLMSVECSTSRSRTAAPQQGFGAAARSAPVQVRSAAVPFLKPFRGSAGGPAQRNRRAPCTAGIASGPPAQPAVSSPFSAARNGRTFKDRPIWGTQGRCPLPQLQVVGRGRPP
jgi:hypothetical protein